jgi:hypothetical protein
MNAETRVTLYHNVLFFGLITGALTSLWIGFEYFLGTVFGIPQLGPLYGLVSIAMFIIMTSLFLRRTTGINPDQTYTDRLWYNGLMILMASIFVVFFLLLYYSLMDPSEYRTYEIEVFNFHLRHVLLTSIVGAWIGTLVEGVLFGSIMALFIKPKRK